VTNRTISVGPASACPMPLRGAAAETDWPEGCEPIRTWFEVARDKGRATGLVTTTHVVDATPAAFVAHSPSRYSSQAIARQFAEFGLDVLLGGGRSHFLGTPVDDGGDLFDAMCKRSDCLGSAEELDDYVPSRRPLVGLFTSGDMDEHDPRPVSLPDMVDAALAKLDRHEGGFVAMFETEATDNATHANLPLARVTADMLEFDRAVGIALEFTRRTPGTLLIVTSDHETGGFALVETEGYKAELRYSTRGHSANLVPLFAEGPRAELFGGWRENDEIGRALMDIVRGW
jgi:alkaline phosphatase